MASEYTKNGRIKVAYEFFTKEKGYTPAQATGIIGHLLAESNLSSTGKLGDKGTAGGIAQWRLDRHDNLVKFAGQKGTSWEDFRTQLEFVDHELNTSEKFAGDELRKAKTPTEAAIAFMHFERPQHYTRANPTAGHNWRGRENHARNLYGLFTGEAVPEFQTAQFSTPGTPQERARVNDLAPQQPMTDYVQAKQRMEAAEGPGFLDASGAALRQGQTLSYLWNSPPATTADPSYSIAKDQDWFKERTKGIRDDDLSAFATAHSREHAEWMASRIESKYADEKTLAGYGWSGVGLRFASELLDPVSIAAGVGIGSLVKVGKMGMAGKAALGAAEGAAGNLAVDALRAPSDPTYGAVDAMWSVGAGMVFGGTLGAFAKNPDLAPGVAQIGQEMMRVADGWQPRSVGAAHFPTNDPLRSGTWELMSDLRFGGEDIAPHATNGKFRFSLSAALGTSENDMTRLLGDQLLTDGAPQKGRVATITAEARKVQIQTEATAKWREAFESGFDEWAKEGAVGGLSRSQKRAAFEEMIYDAIDSTNPLRETNPIVERVASAHRQLMDHLHDLQANPGLLDGGIYRPVRGFSSENKAQNYVARMFDTRKIDDSVDTYRVEQLTDALTKSIKSVQTTLDDALATAFAKAIIRRGRETVAGMNRGVAKAFSGEDLDFLKQILREGGDLDEKQIETIAGAFKPSMSKGDSGKVDHAKRRVMLNERFQVNLHNFKTGGTDTKTIADLLYRKDIDGVFKEYAQEASANIALAMVKVKNPRWAPDAEGIDEFLINGITNKAEFQSLLEKVKAVSAEMKHDPEKDLKRLQFVYDKITGVPTHTLSGDTTRALRMIGQYNYLRYMGQVGLAQIPELMNTVATFGVKAMLDGIPQFKGLLRNAQSKQLGTPLLREMELWTGSGSDWFRHANFERWEDGVPYEAAKSGISKGMEKVEEGLHHATRAQTALSLMGPIDAFLKRGTLATMAHWFAGAAAKVESGKSAVEAASRGVGRSKDMINRLKTVGVDEKMFERIIDQMRKHSTWEKGEITGKNLRSFDLDKWDDLQAASHLKMAMFGFSRRVIQENDIGGMAMWMSHPMARMMLQFRTFMLNAWDKQFMYNINMKDFTSFQYMTLGIFAGALTYTGQTYVNSLLRGDAEKFLEKRLAPHEIGMAGFQRWAGSGLIPMAIDTAVAPFNDGKAIFNGRNTQLPSQAILGAPAIDLYDTAQKSIRSAAEVAGGRPMDKQDTTAWRNLLPFQNTIPAMLLYNALTDGLPQGQRR